MQIIAWDTETFPILKGLVTPRLVVSSYDDGESSGLLTPEETIGFLTRALSDPDTHLVGHNIMFDIVVAARHHGPLLAMFLDAADQGRIHDTMLREKLINMALGEYEYRAIATAEGVKNLKQEYSLGALVYRHFGKSLGETKGGLTAWRTRYNELAGRPHEEWPQEAVDYAVDDAKWTRKLFMVQARERFCSHGQVSGPEGVQNEAEQVQAAIALALMSAWGIRASGPRTLALSRRLQANFAADRDRIVEAGLLKPSKTTKTGFSKNLKLLREMIDEAYEGKAPRTAPTAKNPNGQVSTSAETLMGSGSELLEAVADMTSYEKTITTYMDTLKQAAKVGINPSYDYLKVTGRTGSFDPNVQQQPRKAGVRECYVPRKGYVMCAIDYDSLELSCLSQVYFEWFGTSPLGDAINDGLDPHLDLGSQLLGKPYEWCKEARKGLHGADMKAMVNEHRQIAKAANFGFPGGLGPSRFIGFAAGYGVELSEQEARNLREVWKRRWGMKAYLDHVSDLLAGRERTTMVQMYSERFRGGCNFTEACNTMFQGLAADGAKEALRLLARACYVDANSPLFGARPVAFIHDEILFELPEETAVPAAHEAARLMVQGMKKFVPDFHIGAEPALMLRWYKDAEPFYTEPGNPETLAPWYKLGVWGDIHDLRWSLDQCPHIPAVLVGPKSPEWEEYAQELGLAYQVAKSKELAAFGSDVFACTRRGDRAVAESQGTPVLEVNPWML